MDNVNVLRTGFYAPEFSLPDSSGEVFSLAENFKDCFIALCFFPSNPDEKIRKHLKELNKGIPRTSFGLETKLIGICPGKINVVAGLKAELKLDFPILADQKIDVSSRYYLINTDKPGRSVHFSIIVIDTDRIIRHRVSEHSGYNEFDCDRFKADISGLI